MKKKEQSIDNIIKETKFRITFHLTLYLHQFLSESLARQGYYFITVTLVPKAGILKTNDRHNNINETYSSHVFYIKNNSITPFIIDWTELLNELFIFSFSVEQQVLLPTLKNKYKLLLIFDLMLCNNNTKKYEEVL